MTTEQKPEQITDWAADYDIFHPDYVKDPYAIWDELRRECPVAHSERWGGSWMPTRYADLFEIAKDTTHFSSQQVLVAPIVPEAGEEGDQFYGVRAPPITSDPPEHTWARRLLLPPFSVRSIEKWEG